MKKKRTKNPVARFMNDFNKPATHKDKTKYSRKAKHKARPEPFFCGCVINNLHFLKINDLQHR